MESGGPDEQDPPYGSSLTSDVGRVLFFRLRSLRILASFGETRRSAVGAKAVGPGGAERFQEHLRQRMHGTD